MKHMAWLVVATATFLTGGVLAAPFLIDDVGVDYLQTHEDTEVETAYIAFTKVGGELVVTFDDVASPTSLPPIDFIIPDLDREDLFGNEFNADLSDIEEVGFVNAGRVTTSLDVSHPDVTLGELAAAYADALRALGFGVQVEHRLNGSSASLVAEDANGILRIQMARSGTDARVHFWAY